MSKQSGIYAPFVDTRHNENISKFLMLYGEKYDIQELLDSFYYYPSYILHIVNKNKVIDFGNGSFLLPDYFNDYSNNLTHSSLNHQLAIVNVMLIAYKNTQNQEYYYIAKSLITAIENLNRKWIREDGDLWYGLGIDKKMEGRDYEVVTLDDLLTAQKLLVEIGHKRNEVFNLLISSKLKYLMNNKISIPNYTRNLLKEQGFL